MVRRQKQQPTVASSIWIGGVGCEPTARRMVICDKAAWGSRLGSPLDSTGVHKTDRRSPQNRVQRRGPIRDIGPYDTGLTGRAMEIRRVIRKKLR